MMPVPQESELTVIGSGPEYQPSRQGAEPPEEEIRRLRAEVARVRADAQRMAQEIALLQRSAAWALLVRYHRVRQRLIPPNSRRERVYRKLVRFVFRCLGLLRDSQEPGPSAAWMATPPPPVRSEAAPPPSGTRAGAPVSPQLALIKESFTGLRRSEVESFLFAGHRLAFPSHEQPLVSIVVVVYNRADLTFQCLRTLAENAEVPFELIVVDNASSDLTASLLDRVEPVQIIHNETNLHFLRACNQAAPRARGEYLLLLNNDVSLLPGSLAAAIRTISSSPDIGAVGAKLILVDGTLQEAGSMVWQDGSCLGYGRGDSPLRPQYMFQRDVDFCSGAFLLTRRDLFIDGGGFDEEFAPAYYEEVDYCMRLRELGKRVVYDPAVVAYHFEFGSSPSGDAPILLQQLNRSKFAQKHAAVLAWQCPPDVRHVLTARSAGKDRRRVLVIDDRVPHQFLGSGFPRTRAMLQAMVNLGYVVTFYPMTQAQENWESVYQDIPRSVEVMIGYGIEGLEAFFRERRGLYAVIMISRPHNMEYFGAVWRAHRDWFSGTRIVYDAEAIFGLREIGRREIQGRPLSKPEAEALITDEVALAGEVDAVVCVTEQEATHYRTRGVPSVIVLGHRADAQPTAEDFASRSHLLFVGAIHEEDSANADSLVWFADHVLPEIQAELGEVELFVAGLNASRAVARLAERGIRLLGPIDDLRGLYASCRVFVAPTRFASGLPIKICEAAAHGVPVVATPLLASQLCWEPGRDLFVGNGAHAFARACIDLYRDRTAWERVRASALNQVRSRYSAHRFRCIVAELCEPDLGPHGAAPGPEHRVPVTPTHGGV